MTETTGYPVDLVLVRHGESESNYAQERSRAGDESCFTPEFKARHTSHYRLTSIGQEQARITGEYIRNHVLPAFDVYYCSEYIRALETAALLGFENARWDTEIFLREQDLGKFTGESQADREDKFAAEIARRKRDAFYFCPAGGESIAMCTERVERWLHELHRTCSGLRVLAVCHGNILKSIFVRLERMLQTDWPKFTTDEHYKTYNCQVIHYSRRNPDTGEIHSKLQWVKSVCPALGKVDGHGTGWRKIVRTEMTNEDLMAIVRQSARMLDNQDLLNVQRKLEHHAQLSSDPDGKPFPLLRTNSDF